ncbi:hypothetical protein SY88_13150 [Clostridiales bacterium PH28_bin88]|nr:hypothetical protein SY88_13150 [Clostridiales bacterium PH28_bin88]
MRIQTRTITYMAVLVATSIILTRYFGAMIPIAGVGALRISFGEVPIILAGLMLGPLAGALTGAAADLLGFVINSFGGPYFPGFTLTAALTGMLPALLLKGTRDKGYTWGQLLGAILIADVITSVILNTLWINMMYGKAIAVLLPPRIIARSLLVPAYTIIIHAIVRRSAATWVWTKNSVSAQRS